MSETDDTDVLLLIPPNFFFVQSSGSEDSLLESSRTVVHKPLSCTAHVIGKLVNQVQTLESRLESLEISTDLSSYGSKSFRKALDTTDSVDSRSLDSKFFTFPRRRRRKTVRKESKRELSLTSLDSLSTYKKSIPPLNLKHEKSAYPKPVESINDTRSMDGDISSIVSTPSKKTDKLLLNEIDEFLTKVESYESPESKYKENERALSPDNIIKATGDYLSQKLDSKHDEDQIKLPSGRIVNSSILDKYIYLVKNSGASAQPEKTLPSTSDYRNHYETINRTMESTAKDNTKPLETKSSIRKLNFDKDVQPTSTPKRNTQNYLDTFRPTSNKIYDRATKVLEQYKAQTSRNAENSDYLHQTKDEFKLPQMRPYCEKDGIRMQNKLLDSIDTDLLSLSELWGEKAEQERAERVDSLKLEEERLKREHCESIIQQLQKKVLEQQEKLAVAIKVDKSKDVAISKLKEAWLRLTGSLDKAEERHRAALEKMVREVENFRMVADETQKKTNHFETELYKALDLAHDYQEKCKHLTSEKQELENSMMKTLASKQEVIGGKEKEIEALKENYETVMRLNKQSTDCVKSLEDALEKEKSEHDQTKHRYLELTRKLQSAADDNTLIAQERDLLREKVNEERARCNMMERQLCDKQNLASELLKKCDTLDAEVKTLRKHLDLQKHELKSHYQKQLEDAVLGKLHEFQQQLDLAARDLEAHARDKENDIVDTFNKQISRIEEHSSDDSSRRRRATLSQLETLWEFLNSHKEIATGYNKSAQAREYSRRMWESVAEALNSQGEGAVKDWKGWSSYWVDYKAKLKKRAAVVRAAQHRTGGGPLDVAPLTEIEKKFLGLLGDGFGIGLPNIQVDPFPTSSSNTASLASEPPQIQVEEVPPPPPHELLQEPLEFPQEAHEVPQLHPSNNDEVEPPVPQPERRRRRRRESQMSQEAARRTLVELSRERLQLETRIGHNLEQLLNTMERIANTLDRHKLEVNVLEEKQREEIKLYRLQLAQASEKVGLLESKLESYRRRRGQLATQLHGVMEAQWRQALLILTHGQNHTSLDNTRLDSVSTPAAHDYAPPKIPPLTMPHFADKGLTRSDSMEKGFNFEALSDHELQHYVKLLLTKPPNLDGSGDSAPLRELTEEPTSDRPEKDRRDKVKRGLNNSKPPWKA